MAAEKKKASKKGVAVVVGVLLLVVAVVLIWYFVIRKDDEGGSGGGSVTPTPTPTPSPTPELELCYGRACITHSTSLGSATWFELNPDEGSKVTAILESSDVINGFSSTPTYARYRFGQVYFMPRRFYTVYGISDEEYKAIYQVFQESAFRQSLDPEKVVLDMVTKPGSEEVELRGRVYDLLQFPVSTLNAFENRFSYGDRNYVRIQNAKLFVNGDGACFCQISADPVTQVASINQTDWSQDTFNCEPPTPLPSGVQQDAILPQSLRENQSRLTVNTDDTNGTGYSNQYGVGFLATTEPFSQRDLNLILAGWKDTLGSSKTIEVTQTPVALWIDDGNAAPTNADMKFIYSLVTGDIPAQILPEDLKARVPSPTPPQQTLRVLLPRERFFLDIVPTRKVCEV